MSTTPSCWKPPWQPLWWSGLSPLTRHPSTYVWTKGMTIPPATKLPLPTGIRPTYDVLVRRSWIASARRPIRPDVGWWNEPCRGCPSAEALLVRYDKKASNFLGRRTAATWAIACKGQSQDPGGDGTPGPQRPAEHLDRAVQLQLSLGEPVISVDTKKKELVGPFKTTVGGSCVPGSAVFSSASA